MALMPDNDAVVHASQIAWLTLCSMMLFSRFLFQAKGAPGMRAFLNAWKGSTTHRVWGFAALIVGVAIAVGAVNSWRGLNWRDVVVVTTAAAVLSADGLLNLCPSWFGNFKERMQAAWVKRHSGSPRANDRDLFGTVNVALGAASLLVGAAVYAHRPLTMAWLAGSFTTAVALTMTLLFACEREARHREDLAG